MRNYFTFGDEDSRNYNVYINGSGAFNAPGRAYNMVSIPGRNGDLILSQNRYQNIEVTYPAFISRNFKTSLEAFRSMLLATTSYKKLVDTYNPDEFRAAYFGGGIDVSPTAALHAGEFDVTFNCKPQRFLASGELAVEVASGDAITNPTLFPARPVIYVEGYGNLTIGSDVITIANQFPAIVIDSEILDCYASTGNPIVNSAIVGAAVLGMGGYVANANGAVTFATEDFPLLQPSATRITYDSTITKVTITPRWWRL